MTGVLLPAMPPTSPMTVPPMPLLQPGVADLAGVSGPQMAFAAIFGDIAVDVPASAAVNEPAIPADLTDMVVLPEGPLPPEESLFPDVIVPTLPTPPADLPRPELVRSIAQARGESGATIVELRLVGESSVPKAQTPTDVPAASRDIGPATPATAIVPQVSPQVPARPSDGARERQPAPVISATVPERTASVRAMPIPEQRPTLADTVPVPAEPLPGDATVPLLDTVPVSAPQEARRGAETVTLHRPADAPPPAERQIAAAVIASPGGRTEILLDPQELGRVRVSLEGDESALVLTIQAERSETADLLRRNADILIHEFREAGYENLAFSFSDHPRDTDRAENDEVTPGAASGALEILADFAPQLPGSGTLDLRL